MKERLNRFDNLKFLLIILVVFGHFIDYFFKYSVNIQRLFIMIYGFHMPLFIFMTGFFSKRVKKFKDIDYKKIFFYIIVAFLMKVSIFIIESIYYKPTFDMFGGSDIYWFLIVISIYTILTPMISKFNLKFLLIFSIVLALLAGYDNNIGDFLALSRTIVFFPFFLSGYVLSEKKEEFNSFINKSKLKYLAIIAIIAYILLCIFKINYMYNFRGLFVGRSSYVILHLAKYAWCKRAIAYIIQFTISASILLVIPNKEFKWFTKFGKKSIQVYMFHVPIVIIFNQFPFINKLFHKAPNAYILFCLVISILMSYIFSSNIFTCFIDKFKGFIFSKEKRGEKI